LAEERIVTTPAARRLAREKGIDILALSTGPGKRITERDVLAALEAQKKPELLEAGRSSVQRLGVTIPITRMREVIAKRLTKSWESPHIYLATEIDATEIVRSREELQPVVEQQTAQKLTYNDILIVIVAQVIQKFPILNGMFEEDRITIPEDINIGLAVALEDGLVVPVLRRANHKTLGQIVRLRADLVARSRKRKLQVDELQGATFSISNLGMFDVDFFTAILNPPQSGILSVGTVRQIPVAVSGEVRIKPIFKAVLGVDHRIVDGAVAAAFLQAVKQRLEKPLDHLVAARE
jgi:pyruvate dehydrogenase E2 component (dihydrolipoamide acetyltransferase)